MFFCKSMMLMDGNEKIIYNRHDAESDGQICGRDLIIFIFIYVACRIVVLT